MSIALFLKVLVVLVPALVLLFKYLLGDKHKIEKIRAEIAQKEKEMRDALAKNDTVRISVLERDLKRLRDALKHYTAAK